MERKKITPSIRGTFEYIEDETSKFDKYSITVNGVLTAYLYLPKKANLLPQSISFKEELQVETIY